MYSFTLLFLISFLGTLYVMPHSIRKLRENGYIAQDMYKNTITHIPTNAGMILIFTSLISISLQPLIARLSQYFFNFNQLTADFSETDLAFLLVICVYALYGLVDDLVDVGRILKLLLPITFAFPLISVLKPELITIPLLGNIYLEESLYHEITRGDIFRIVIIPIYVMVVANLVNMHSGYNGLQSGLSLIILTTLSIKSFFDGILNQILPLGSIMGSISVFYIYNRYPSKVFEGNIGSLFFGSVIGTVIVVQEFWFFGFFILIPHTLNFMLWLIWLYKMKFDPSNYLEPNGKHKKFGKVEENGTIKVPNMLTLKWIPNYYFPITERDSTQIMYLITIIFVS